MAATARALIAAAVSAVAWRGLSAQGLVAKMQAPVARRWRYRDDDRGRPGSPPVAGVRRVLRLGWGFRPVLEECAAVAAVLRRCGWNADMVVGADPVPDQVGRSLHAWIEISHHPVGTYLPARTYLVELARFPDPGQPPGRPESVTPRKFLSSLSSRHSAPSPPGGGQADPPRHQRQSPRADTGQTRFRE
jgi:hypothetical protein